jgi:hypothetical protein
MPNYQDAVIYKIYSHCCDDVYIGSTTQNLRVRLGGHIVNYKQWKNGKKHYVSSFEILNQDHYDIMEICKAPCNSKQELHRIEGEYIKIIPNCINKNIAGRNSKQYYLDNKEEIKIRRKQYRQNNKGVISRQKKIHHQKYRDVNLEKMKQYHKNNRDKIMARKSEKYICECGSILGIGVKARHERSNKHFKYTLQYFPFN